jgi:alpha-ketoglutarate-dependent taurine dioxygenase
MSPSTLEINRLSDTVGAEVHGVTADQLATDVTLATGVLEALDANGVLVFGDLHLEPEAQVEFCKKLGEIDYSAPNHRVPGIYVVSLDESKNKSAAYLHGTFHWHIDGCTPQGDECPQMATVLTAVAVADHGGDTEFASTYAAYDDLTDDEKERLSTLRVVHSLEASQRKVNPEPSDAQLAGWRKRKPTEHPLVWTHRNGRRSLVLGASADHVVGRQSDASQALLDDLLGRATRPDRVYRHSWSAGDTVIWDNRGVLHRAVPYDATSPREMLRTTVLGDEPIQ